MAGVAGWFPFQFKLINGLRARGIQSARTWQDTPYQAVLVIGGTRNLTGYGVCAGKTSQSWQRLDGMIGCTAWQGVRQGMAGAIT